MGDVINSLLRLAVNIVVSVVGALIANFIDRYLRNRRKREKCSPEDG